MAAVTVETLLEEIRVAADMVGSEFVADTAASLIPIVNRHAKELHGILVSKFEDYAGPTSQTVNVVANTASYALTAFAKIHGVDALVDGRYFDLHRLTFKERNARNTIGSFRDLRYRLSANNLVLHPTPTTSGTLRVWYTPEWAGFDATADSADFFGYEAYIVHGVAAELKEMEESDPSVQLALQQRVKERIDEDAKPRDIGTPASVVDVYAEDFEDDLWLR